MRIGSRRAAQVVKLVALAGGAAPIDVVVEGVWPGDKPGAGRNRLRNVLSHLRADIPDLVVRDHDDLRFGPDVSIDLHEFDAHARTALDEKGDGHITRVGAARRALALYEGDLLPTDPYAPWADDERRRIRRRMLDLIDLLVEDAQYRSEHLEAVRLLERALDIDPTAEDRRLLVLRLLSAEGRHGRVQEHLHRARLAAEDLGLPMSTRLQRIEAALRRTGPA